MKKTLGVIGFGVLICLVSCNPDTLVEMQEKGEEQMNTDTLVDRPCLDNFIGTYSTVVGSIDGDLTLLDASISIEEVADSFVFKNLNFKGYDEIPLLSCSRDSIVFDPIDDWWNVENYELVNEDSLVLFYSRVDGWCTERVRLNLSKRDDTLYYDMSSTFCSGGNGARLDKGFALEHEITNITDYKVDLRRYANSSELLLLSNVIYLFRNNSLIEFDTLSFEIDSIVLDYTFDYTNFDYAVFNHPTRNDLVVITEAESSVSSNSILSDSKYLVFDLEGDLVQEVVMSELIGMDGEIISSKHSNGSFYILTVVETSFVVFKIENLDLVFQYSMEGDIDNKSAGFYVDENSLCISIADDNTKKLFYSVHNLDNLALVDSYEISTSLESYVDNIVSSVLHNGYNYLLTDPSGSSATVLYKFDSTGIEFLAEHRYAFMFEEFQFSDGTAVGILDSTSDPDWGTVYCYDYYIYNQSLDVITHSTSQVGISNRFLDIELVDDLYYVLSEYYVYIYSQEFELLQSYAIKNE